MCKRAMVNRGERSVGSVGFEVKMSNFETKKIENQAKPN